MQYFLPVTRLERQTSCVSDTSTNLSGLKLLVPHEQDPCGHRI